MFCLKWRILGRRRFLGGPRGGANRGLQRAWWGKKSFLMSPMVRWRKLFNTHTPTSSDVRSNSARKCWAGCCRNFCLAPQNKFHFDAYCTQLTPNIKPQISNKLHLYSWWQLTVDYMTQTKWGAPRRHSDRMRRDLLSSRSAAATILLFLTSRSCWMSTEDNNT